MNMFRDLLAVALVALGIGVWFSDPTTWTWARPGGPYVAEALKFLGDAKPFSFILMFVFAIALFMTRKQY